MAPGITVATTARVVSYARSQLPTLHLYPNLFKVSLYTLPGSSISFNSFFMRSSLARRGRPTFRLTQDSWLKGTILGNLSSFIHRMRPSHISLSSNMDLESMIEPHFCIAYCLKYGQSGGYPEQFVGNFSENI